MAAAVERRKPSLRQSTKISSALIMVTSHMNSRPDITALASRAKPSVARMYAAIRIQPNGGWSYQ